MVKRGSGSPVCATDTAKSPSPPVRMSIRYPWMPEPPDVSSPLEATASNEAQATRLSDELLGRPTRGPKPPQN